jgi:DNA polymerase-3 subunit chi
MADIQFHTLQEASPQARLRRACLLTEQAFLAGERVLVWLQDAAALEQFDSLLWTFGDRSFVPHEPLAEQPARCEAPVQLHAGATLDAPLAGGGFTTLLMLRAEASSEVLQFARVIEVVDADPAVRNAGRARFRYYREQGCTPQHFEVKND